jgi:SARP family transcriptional regulator, regulator of embCAB operon
VCVLGVVGMRVLVLGCPVVERDREVLSASRRRASVLLGVFGLRPNRRLPVGWLVGALWPERPPPSAAANLRSHIAELRRLLRPSATRSGGAPTIESSGDGYLLAAEPAQVDASWFLHVLREGRRARDAGADTRAAGLLSEALGLWRGPAFDGLPVPAVVQPQATLLDEERLAAIEELVDIRLALGHHRVLVPQLEALVREHPLRERLWHQLLLALTAAGRRSEVVDAYRRLTRLLDSELGVAPSLAVTELHDLVRRGG